MRLSSLTAGFAVLFSCTALCAPAEPIQVGKPLGSVNEAGVFVPMSSNVRVYGSFDFAESCIFDPKRNVILAVNIGLRQNVQENDGYVSLIHPDGSVHTSKWIGATRDNLTLNDPRGSAINKGILYLADLDFLRSFDLDSGQPLEAIELPDATMLNGIGVTADGTAYISNTRPVGRIYRVTADGRTSTFVEGAPLDEPNGIAIDREGNVVVVNVGDNAVLTFNLSGDLIATEHSIESGNDGLVVTEDGTKYVSSVRFGSVSRIRRGQPAEIIASGIPSPASMCYDPIRKQLVIPMNPNNALAFISLADVSP
jgi:sugar lactone lactonase YvrE